MTQHSIAISNFPTGFSKGVLLRGVPVKQIHSGRIFWVNNSSVRGSEQGVGGSNGNDGTYVKPFKTIDYTIGRCVKDRGDIIMVMENHSEDIVVTNGIMLDVDGVSIVGLGQGDTQARVTFSTSAASFDIDCKNWTIENMWFEAIIVSATGVFARNDSDDGRIANCRFSVRVSGNNSFINTLSINTSNRIEVVDNHFDSGLATTGSSAIRLGGTSNSIDMIIAGNHITGRYLTACVSAGDSKIQEHIVFANNTFHMGTHNSGLETKSCVQLQPETTGLFQDNQLYTNVPGAVTEAVQADGLLIGGGNFVQTSANMAPLPFKGGVHGIVRSTVVTGKVDETDDLALFTVTDSIFVHGITQRAEVAANSAIELGMVIDATEVVLNFVMVDPTNMSGETTIGDYGVPKLINGVYTIVGAEDTNVNMMWDTSVLVPDGIIKQTSTGTPGTLVSGYIIYWTEASVGATCVPA